MMKRLPFQLVIIGNGPWGQALGQTFKSSFEAVFYIDRSTPESTWTSLFKAPSFVILACPFSAIRHTLKKLAKKKIIGIINGSKGIDPETLGTFSTLAKQLGFKQYATLSGPTFAKELLKRRPSAAVLASPSQNFSKKWASALSRDYFRLYTSRDIRGVEVCGAVKNIMAIACGISDGLKLGENARAALLTRGLKEIQILTQVLSGKSSTVSGLAGAGDLWLTANGSQSRNRQLGLLLSKRQPATSAISKISGTCEGFFTVKQVHKISKKYKIELPICSEIYRICYEGKDPRLSLKSLMTRDLKSE